MVSVATDVTEFLRDDYREFTQLFLVYLGAADEVTFRRPEALHKAHWMAKLIYSLKLAVNEAHIQDLSLGTITTMKQIPKVRSFTTFLPMFMLCGGSLARRRQMHHGMI